MPSRFLLLSLSLFPFIAHGALDFYFGYGDQNDRDLKKHYMYNRSIGIYHRRLSDDLKFCSDKRRGSYSMGPCKNFYAECDKRHNLAIAMCPVGQLYRGEEGTCVDESMEPRCYHVQYADDDQQCKRSKHQEMIALGACQNQYGVCFGGSVYFVDCPRGDEAFSDFHGACLPKHEHPKCDSHSSSSSEEHHSQSPTAMQFWPLSTVCRSDAKTDYEMYLGACNQKYMLCGRDGYDFLAQCEKDTVADGSVGECVPISQSSSCAAKWEEEHRDDAAFIEHMNTILKSIDYCRAKQNGLYFDPYSECRREAIFCFKGQASFHLCQRSFGVDEKGWCMYKEACSKQEQEPEQWRSYYLAAFASDAQLCRKTEIDGTHVFGLCDNFYGRCRRGRFEIETCEDSEEIFDPQFQSCRLPAEDDHCDKFEDPKPINRCMDADREKVSKLASTGKCEETFLVCINGWETTFKCEKRDYAFDELSEHCIPKSAHPDCPDYIVTELPAEEIIEETTTTPEQKLTCHGDGGFQVHEDDCTKFYRCAHGRLVEMSCPTATAFDPAINVCNHKHMVPRCGDNTA